MKLHPESKQDFFELLPCQFAGMTCDDGDGCAWHRTRYTKKENWIVPPLMLTENETRDRLLPITGTKFSPAYDGQKWSLQAVAVCSPPGILCVSEEDLRFEVAMATAVKIFLDGHDDDGDYLDYQ